MKKPVALMLIAALSAAGPAGATPPTPEPPILTALCTVAAADCAHTTGRAGSQGWEADRRVHRPGVLLDGPRPPLLLGPGSYRATLRMRRGMYPRKGLLRQAEQILRFDVKDDASGRVLTSRVIDVSELPTANHYEDRWMEFTLEPGSDRLISASVSWLGGINCEVESVSFDRIGIGTPAQFAARARGLEDRVRRNHLENGFVVSRKKNGDPDEIGDATTYTGFYAAALAWHLSVEKDDQTTQDLENALGALHAAIKGDAENPILARFVDADGAPHPASPSKDVYTGFFFGCSVAYPRVENAALRRQIRTDVGRIATRLLKDGLVVRGGKTVLASFAPYFTPEEVQTGIRRLVGQKDRVHAAAKAIREASAFAPFQSIWPGIRQLVRALERRDQTALFRLAVPTADGIIGLTDRVIQILREEGRQDLIGPKLNRAEPAALRLAALLGTCLKKLPPPIDGRRLRQLSDLRVLSSNALIALHIIKTAAVITGDPRFEDYYRNNLYGQDALLRTALDWYGVDDDLLRVTAGNAGAARQRQGYLALMAAYNLYQLETNPAVKETYAEILRRELDAERHDGNPLITAFALSCGIAADRTPLLEALTEYPDSPDGLGDAYWHFNARLVAQAYGGGENGGYSSEPLPVSQRPRDSFLWQRGTRRLAGDLLNSYPGADYVFLYWLARRHHLIDAPDQPTETASSR